MSKHIVVISRATITKAALVEIGGWSMNQAKAAYGYQYIINTWFYDMDTGRPMGNLKINGMVKVSAGWNGWELVQDKSKDISLEIIPAVGRGNYINGVELLIPTRGPGKVLNYPSEYGDTWGRSAVLLAGARMILCCSDGGTADARTPEGLRDGLMIIGCRYSQTTSLWALDLGMGSSPNCDPGDGQRISNGKWIKGYLRIRTTGDGQKSPKQEGKSMNKYTVAPGIDINTHSDPDISYDKVGVHSMGIVVDMLEVRDGWGRATKGWASLAYLEAVEGPQRVINNDIAIQEYIISDERKSRPGRDINPDTYITVRGTGNAAKDADATAHGAHLDGAAGEDNLMNWHYTADDHVIVQHLPNCEAAYHAGDGEAGPGNTTNIGIETCVNTGRNPETAKTNAATLAHLLAEEYDILLDNVAQHNRWNGKDCPKTIRATTRTWGAFLALCREGTANASKLDIDVNTLTNVGIIDQPDYWKAGNYFKDTVEALIGKVADHVKEDDRYGIYQRI